jgi:GST-like protein
MIAVHFWPTPNGFKITIALEEMGVPYRIVPVDIGHGAQFEPGFLAISPNNRMPAIVDDDPIGGGAPLSIFESAAILQYLAEKTGKLMPRDVRGRYDVLQWVAWQVANLGPAAGQRGFFRNYAAEKVPFAIQRFDNEVHRLYGVLDRRLADRPFLAGDFSIADVASFPWVAALEKRKPGETPPKSELLDEFPHVARWLDAMAARPATDRGWRTGRDLRKVEGLDDAAKKVLFGQRARKT